MAVEKPQNKKSKEKDDNKSKRRNERKTRRKVKEILRKSSENNTVLNSLSQIKEILKDDGFAKDFSINLNVESPAVNKIYTSRNRTLKLRGLRDTASSPIPIDILGPLYQIIFESVGRKIFSRISAEIYNITEMVEEDKLKKNSVDKAYLYIQDVETAMMKIFNKKNHPLFHKYTTEYVLVELYSFFEQYKNSKKMSPYLMSKKLKEICVKKLASRYVASLKKRLGQI